MKKSSSIANWREKMGITQQALADYLQVGRSLLSMAELGERELPLSAFMELTQLMNTYETISATELVPQSSPEEKQAELAFLRQTIQETTWQLANLNRELATLESDARQATYQLLFFQTIRQQVIANSNEPNQERQLLWLDIREIEARKKAAAHRLRTRRTLRLKIVALKATLQEAQQMVEELEGGV